MQAKKIIALFDVD